MGNSSRIKKNKSKQPLVFAKDKKQGTLAIVVVVAFFATSIFMIVKHFQEQNTSDIKVTQQNISPAGAQNPIAQPLPNLDPSAATSPDAQGVQQDANNIYSQTVGIQKGTPGSPNQNLKTAQASEGEIEILPKKTDAKKNEKLVLITVTNLGRQNPFLPTSEGSLFASSASSSIYLLPPPETLPQNTEASKVIATTISGILYDKYNPSAIINIEGTDYLVKKGDVINNYKVLSISKAQVVVQLGKNIYSAGVGELLSPDDLKYSVANLNKKFGGNNVSINVRRKGY